MPPVADALPLSEKPTRPSFGNVPQSAATPQLRMVLASLALIMPLLPGKVVDTVNTTSLVVFVPVVVLVSAAIFALALKQALQAHAELAPLTAATAAGATYFTLVMLHLLLKPRASRIAPALHAQPRRRAKAARGAVDVAPQPTIAQGPVPMTPNYVPPPSADQPATAGFEHLQSLVAELARMTPGPKARTPDPDAVQAATAAAWAEYASTRAAVTAIRSPQPPCPC